MSKATSQPVVTTSKKFEPSKYVTPKLNAQTVTKLKEVFDVFDADGSGNISSEELVNTIIALNLESQASQILSIVHNAGHQGDMDFGVFLQIFGFNGESTSESTLQSIFDAFDTAGTGAFGPEQFEQVALSVGQHLSAAEVDQMIEYADKDRDGLINYEQFLHVMTKEYPKI